MADAVIEAIRDGQIRGYSFRGRIYKSSPQRVPRASRGGQLPTVTRTELGLGEYGPTPTPAYADAGILAIRSAFTEFSDKLIERIASLPATHLEPGAGPATSIPEAGTEEPHDTGHSIRLRRLALAQAIRDRRMQ
jgi:hypothetical protein